jgi:hypothetical protein
MVTAVGIHVLLLVQIVFYPLHVQSDDTWWGWDQLAAKVGELETQYPEHFMFSRDGYKTTAVLNYYLDTNVYAANVVGEHALQYSIHDHDLGHLGGRNALFLDSENMPRRFDEPYSPPEVLHPYFDSIRLVAVIPLERKGKTLRQFRVVECFNYHPEPGTRNSR